jgi:antitoxin PrlF
MQKAKVTFKGQITIPKEIRDALNIEEGESVIFAIEGDHAIMKPFKKKSILDFYGSLPATRAYPGTEAIRKEIRKKLGKRLNKKG